jgi:hypothetical protein
MLAALPPWLSDAGQVLLFLSTLLAVLGIVGAWVRRSIGRMIDDKLDPIYRRLDEHMSEEDQSLKLIAHALKALSEHLDP